MANDSGPEVKCPLCHRDNDSGSRFCVFCGSDISRVSSGADIQTNVNDQPSASLENEMLELRRWLSQLTQRVVSLESRLRDNRPIDVIETSHVQSAELTVPDKEADPVENQGIVETSPGTGGPSHRGPKLKTPIDWEVILGLNWIAIVGAIALVIGIGFFLKIAFDNNWINQTSRVLLGVTVGFGLMVIGEYFQRRYPNWAHAVTGGGISTLYLSIYSSFGLFQLIDVMPAFAILAILVLLSGFLSLRYESKTIAILGLFGAFLTPVLLSGHVEENLNSYVIMSMYIVLVDLGILFVSSVRNWRYFILIGMIASYVIIGGHPVVEDLSVGDLGFSTLIVAQVLITSVFLIFAGATTLFHIFSRRAPDRLVLSIMILNALFFYSISLSIWQQYQSWYGLITILVSMFYTVVGYLIVKRTGQPSLISLYSFSISLIFFTISIPVQLTESWLVLAWFAEGSVLIWLGFVLKEWRTRIFGLGLLVISSIALLGWATDVQTDSQKIFLNERFPNFVFGIMSLYVSAFLYYKSDHNLLQRWEIKIAQYLRSPIHLFLVALANFMTVLAITVEMISYSRAQDMVSEAYIMFSITGIWSIYFAILLWIGFSKRSQYIRNISLGLIAIATIKFLILDTFAGSEVDYPFFSDFVPILNVPFVVSMILIVSVGLSAYLYRRNIDTLGSRETSIANAFLGLLNLLLIWVLTVEINRFFGSRGFGIEQDNQSAKHLVLTVLWSLYSISVIGVGIWKQVREIRLAGLIMLFLVVVKLFVFDVFLLDQGYRVAAFVTLGVLLLATGLIYQRYSEMIRGFIFGRSD